MASSKLSAAQYPVPGDHIWVLKRGYSHHGLFLGDVGQGEPLVAHYAGWVEGLTGGPLELVHYDEFAQDSTVRVRRYRQRTYSRDESIARVLSRLGEESYDVHSNNCEHLCHWAIMGSARSTQVEWFDSVLGAIHPGFEAVSRSVGTLRSPLTPTNQSHVWQAIAKDLAIDWGLKTAARWVAGPVGVAAYVGYRLTRQIRRHRRH